MKDRGKLLTTLLVLESIYILISLVGLLSFYLRASMGFIPMDVSLFTNGALFIIHLIAVVGIWTWKKWAVLLAIIIAIYTGTIISVNTIKEIFTNNPEKPFAPSQAIGLAILVGVLFLYFWAIKRKWQNFN